MDSGELDRTPPRKTRLLRFAEPACYRLLSEQLALYHLHPFDVHASVRQDDAAGRAEIFIRYGDGPVVRSAAFAVEALQGPADEIADFFRETAKDCKKTLIGDYYKLMKV